MLKNRLHVQQTITTEQEVKENTTNFFQRIDICVPDTVGFSKVTLYEKGSWELVTCL